MLQALLPRSQAAHCSAMVGDDIAQYSVKPRSRRLVWLEVRQTPMGNHEYFLGHVVNIRLTHPQHSQATPNEGKVLLKQVIKRH